MRNKLLPIICLFLTGCFQPDAQDVYNAVEAEDYEKLMRLLEKGVPVSDPSLEKQPIRLAVELDNAPIVLLLLDHGADPNDEDQYGFSLLNYAVKYSNYRIIRILIQNGCDINQRINSHNDSLLIWAVDNHKANDFLDMLINNGADVYYRNSDGMNAFEVAITRNQLRIVRYFLEDLRFQNDRTFSPLLYSLEKGYDEQVWYYLDNPVYVNDVLSDEITFSLTSGWSSLDNPEAIYLTLKDYKKIITPVSLDLSDLKQEMLIKAIENNVDPELLTLYLDSVEDVNYKDSNDHNAFEVALINNNVHALKLLALRFGEDLNCDFPPIQYALENGNNEQLKVLLANSLFVDDLNTDEFWKLFINSWDNLEEPQYIRNLIMESDVETLPDSLWSYLAANWEDLKNPMDLKNPYIDSNKLSEYQGRSLFDVFFDSNYYYFHFKTDSQILLYSSDFETEIGTIPADSKFVLVDDEIQNGFGWYKVVSENFQSGWIILSDYVKPSFPYVKEVQHSSVERVGPELKISLENYSLIRIDSLSLSDLLASMIHRCINIIDDRYIILETTYWEGRDSLVIDTVTGVEFRMNGTPVFLEDRKMLLSCSPFYSGEYWLALYKINNDSIEELISDDLSIIYDTYDELVYNWVEDILYLEFTSYYQNDTITIVVFEDNDSWVWEKVE